MQIKKPVYKDSIGSWKRIAMHLNTIIDEVQKYSEILHNMSHLMDDRVQGPMRSHKLNWALSPTFEYKYFPSSPLESNKDAKEKNWWEREL